MDYARLKIIFCVAVSLAMLLAPFALEMPLDGNAHAFSSRSGNKGSVQATGKPVKKSQTAWSEYKPLTLDNTGAPPAPHPVPEPATMLLVGSGLAGLAIFRKKFKK